MLVVTLVALHSCTGLKKVPKDEVLYTGAKVQLVVNGDVGKKGSIKSNAKSAIKTNTAFFNTISNDTLDERSQNTYQTLDSLVTATKIEKKILLGNLAYKDSSLIKSNSLEIMSCVSI